MPGRGSYGPGGKWIHDRAQRIMENTTKKHGPEKGKQIAFALATQQAHAMGKTPKKKGGYGTKEGRKVAKEKYQHPKEYRKTAEEKETRVNSLLEKLAVQNLTGRDNRTPFVGQTQFPTEGSKNFAQKLHQQSTGKAEVGPAPLMGELDKSKMVPLGSVVPKMPTPPGSSPVSLDPTKTGAAMDPLTAFIQKHAEALSDNLTAFETEYKAGEERKKPLQARTSDFNGTPAADKKKEEEKLLERLFKHYPSESASIG